MDPRLQVAEQLKNAALKPNGKSRPVLMTDRFGEAEHKRHDYVADIPAGVSVEELLEPGFWAHVSALMDPFDHIEARAEDGTWIAYLVVVYAERNYARVVLDRVLEIVAKVDDQPSSVKHKIEWKGPHHKFTVIRLSDDKSVQDGFRTRFDAETWMRNHEKGMDK